MSIDSLIGFKTATVNGFETDKTERRYRLIYRIMSGRDILQRIQEKLAQHNMSESEASKRATKSPDTIRNLRRDVEKGKVRGLQSHTAEKLATVLNTTASWLLTGEGSDEAEPQEERLTFVPVISWVSAGQLAVPDHVIDIADAPRVALAGLPPGDWIMLDVEGDSMDRISPHGSRIVANRRDKRLVANACYVIAEEDGGATYKRFRPNPDRFEPVSTNPAHDPIYPEGPMTIIGRVRRSIIDM